MTPIVVLQARMNSSRLPGKVLLPVNGIPLVVLAAKRAANVGHKVIVVTSNEPDDDALARILHENGLSCFRGSLNNVLERFVEALSSYPDTTVVVRLTADNVFPDGSFLAEMIQDFRKRKLKYLCCSGQPSGLPYGMSAEVTRLKYLREAHNTTSSFFDQEHVTPFIAQKHGLFFFRKYAQLQMGHYRCTVDSLDDYLAVLDIFSKIADPVSVSSQELIGHLRDVKNQPMTKRMVTELVLGTAQLGMDYGIGNRTGQPVFTEAARILKTAIIHGVGYLDTARAYGTSEAVIGQSLKGGWETRTRVITKLSPLDDCPSKATTEVCRAFVDASVFQSCTYLQRTTLDVLLLHRFTHFFQWKGAAWARLLEHKAEGRISELGVSVQNPEEMAEALNVPEVTFIQLPFSILDQRWDALKNTILLSREKKKIKIHVRSVLLQGLYLSDNIESWQKANVSIPEAKKTMEWLQAMTAKFSRKSIADLCLAYIRGIKWIDGVVVGMESLDQLNQNLDYMDTPPLDLGQIAFIEKSRPVLTEKTLNPTRWMEN